MNSDLAKVHQRVLNLFCLPSMIGIVLILVMFLLIIAVVGEFFIGKMLIGAVFLIPICVILFPILWGFHKVRKDHSRVAFMFFKVVLMILTFLAVFYVCQSFFLMAKSIVGPNASFDRLPFFQNMTVLESFSQSLEFLSKPEKNFLLWLITTVEIIGWFITPWLLMHYAQKAIDYLNPKQKKKGDSIRPCPFSSTS